MPIIPNTPQDYPAHLHRVLQLRASGHYLPELALVTEENGILMGHIMLTRLEILNAPRKIDVLRIAPLSVALEYRNRGVGASLLHEGLQRGQRLGFTAAFLVGAPGYYHRFGFQPSAVFGIKHILPIPDPNVMAYELVPDTLKDMHGTVDC